MTCKLAMPSGAEKSDCFYMKSKRIVLPEASWLNERFAKGRQKPVENSSAAVGNPFY